MKTIVFEVSNGIAKIRFNRPEKYNAFNREMSLALQDALDACTHDKTVRVICLRGAGKSFGSGQDLDEALQNNHLPIRNIVEEHYNPIIRKIFEKMQRDFLCERIFPLKNEKSACFTRHH